MTVIWGALLLLPLSWVISPTSSGESARRYLAVPFGRYPGATFTLLGLVAFVFLLMGAGDQRGFLLRLTIVSMAGVATYLFRQRLVEAYPDADFAGLSEFSDRSREKARHFWSKRPKSLPGRKDGGSGDDQATTAATADSGHDPDETTVLPAAASVDPETARLDQLDRLATMRDRGVLTDEEFAEEKKRLMGDGG